MSAATRAPATPIAIGLNAAIVAVPAFTPLILVIPGTGGEPDSLPAGPFDPLRHRTMEIGLRALVAAQTALQLGYVEQLYTFGDRGRHARPGDQGPHVMSVGYLALTRLAAGPGPGAAPEPAGADWTSWYVYFPWEDWRSGRPAILDQAIVPLLDVWARQADDRRGAPRAASRGERVRIAFGRHDLPWDEERVLDRYELLYEAGLVAEAARDGREAARRWADLPSLPALGRPMHFDHRRILATAISRLRSKIKYRPVIFELMAEEFTLTGLQQTVEAISGRHLHKQNFRRLVDQARVVEPTGATEPSTGGRPAALFRFRREVMRERPASGLRVGGRA